MHTWPLQDAKARLSELINLCKTEGPQMVTRRGEKSAVIVSPAEWERLTQDKKLTLKEWLITDFARTDDLVPTRARRVKLKPPMTFEE